MLTPRRPDVERARPRSISTRQFLTSRGIAVLDVDYGGSTGYGREYRKRLDGQWGIVDVDDCIAAATLPRRAGRRRSASGWRSGAAAPAATRPSRRSRSATCSPPASATSGSATWSSSRRHPQVRVALPRPPARPVPGGRSVYRERSPIHAAGEHLEPGPLLQGLDDRVVPPSQAEPIVDALAANGIPHAYLAFEGEDHGFRGAAPNAARSRRELSFHGQVFGFEPADEIEPLEVVGLGAWREHHPLNRPHGHRRGRRRGVVDRLMDISPIELVLGLLLVAVALGYLARRIGIAYPILLLLGGVVLGYLPGLPEIELEPDLVFLLLLPPILFGAGYSTPIRDFKANARAIGLLAIGLVLFTTVASGWSPRPWCPAWARRRPSPWGRSSRRPTRWRPRPSSGGSGCRVGSSRSSRARASSTTPRRSSRIASAIAVALGGVFSLGQAGLEFVVVGIGGIVVGLVVGWALTEAWRRTADPTLEIMISLLAPFAAYLPAEALHVSGVLAAVVAGLIAGRRAARALSPTARLMGRGVWDIVIFTDQRLRVHADRPAAAVDPRTAWPPIRR